MDKKIIVIEDDKIVRDNIATLLDEEGYKTFQSSDGLEGINLIEEVKPDLIICDIVMPRMNGLEVLQKIRENNLFRPVPFIFLTAKVEKSDLRSGMELGADDYIFKPFSSKELLRAVKVRLKKSEQIKNYYYNKDKIADKRYSYEDKILVNVKDETKLIQILTIKFISAEDQYSKLHLHDNSSVLLRKSLSDWEEILPEDKFIRIHRSTIINIDYVTKLEKWFNRSLRVFIKDWPKELTVSRNYTQKLKSIF